MSHSRHLLTRCAWLIFIPANLILLLAMAALPFVATIAIWICTLLALVGLLCGYYSSVARWRFLLLCGLVFLVLRWLTLWLPTVGTGVIGENLAVFATMQVLNVILAGLFAMVALVIRRDVSVAYIVLPYAVGPLIFRQLIVSAGGVLNFLMSLASNQTVAAFKPVEPLLLAFSCLTTLGFLAFVPHFVRLWVREMRRM